MNRPAFPAATLTIGRDLIKDRLTAILSSIKTDDPAAWDYAMFAAQEIAAAAKTGHVELRHYHEAMAAKPDAYDEAFDHAEMVQSMRQNAHVHPAILALVPAPWRS